ncbi:hypothetical protein M422DRAFT_253704 [Sphaerobolus stellatus SS14]|uniref:Unplaced genomic scaffold SPHSTscaffold_50, whole genome shotgun sequence n=1 Tax=Sphaerobolus stellatus (strain SS14) TaxID=990650 RepID=A0A0C9VWJ7_SPHS4|nr:hypothetical protein M422DRAFT_253704 [Sphaerobolus stellatus SS14]
MVLYPYHKGFTDTIPISVYDIERCQWNERHADAGLVTLVKSPTFMTVSYCNMAVYKQLIAFLGLKC